MIASFDPGFPLPDAHAAFLDRALPRLQADDRIVGVAAGGSFMAGEVDAYSDLDLVIAVEPHVAEALMDERHAVAAGLGPLLTAFTGEHVGEPRLLVCLYGPPPLQVDLKFVALPDAADRVEDPFILWDRDGRLAAVLETGEAAYPAPDVQWIEDRFWVWLHYLAGKLGRGELFEAHDGLALLRMWVLGPLALQARGARPMGLRRVEQHAPAWARAMERTVAPYEAAACADALQAAADLYRQLRAENADEAFVPRREAEQAVLAYLAAIRARLHTP